MRKVIAAVFFMSLGAILMTGAFAFHVVRTPGGHIIVWKVRPSLKDVYADVRDWKPDDWKHHRMLVKALKDSGRGELVPQTRPRTPGPFRAFLDRLKGKPQDRSDSPPGPITQERSRR